ncbi:MAG: sortase [bacterium]|nr:sortase [bacterium]
MQKLRAPLLLSLLAIVFLWPQILRNEGPTLQPLPFPTSPTPLLLSPGTVRYLASLKTPDRLIIPAIQLNVSILDMPIQDGTWMVPEHAVGRGGKNVLFAHSRVKLFKRIDQLGPDQEIFLYSANGTFQAFRPIVTLQTSPDSVQLLDEWPNALLLITCDGTTDQWRTIVVAEPLVVSVVEPVEGSKHERTST